MGQFGNQPDFGTQSQKGEISGDAFTNTGSKVINPPGALYIGTGGDVLVNVVGGNLISNYGPNATLFKNVPSGTFMPVMVTDIWNTYDGEQLTTAADIVILR